MRNTSKFERREVMARQRQLVVRGKQRREIDAAALARLLAELARDLDREQAASSSPDVFEAAIEDREAGR